MSDIAVNCEGEIKSPDPEKRTKNKIKKTQGSV